MTQRVKRADRRRRQAVDGAAAAARLTSALAEIHAEFDALRAKLDRERPPETPEEARMSACDHGVTFDQDEARKMLDAKPPESSAVGFIMGSPAAGDVRTRWPRLHGTCPKGCGFTGIAYASYAHYMYGDW